MHDFIESSKRQVEQSWRQIHRGAFWRHVLEQGIDRELYALLMTEVYHYTRHNAQNQAVAATTVCSDRVGLLRYCLGHALDEAGHDLMVLHDLKSIGIEVAPLLRRRPLPETEAFVAYLYRIASTRDATARLGYSFWAESCYPYIAEVLAAMRTCLQLEDSQMTFFVAHSEIDKDHFKEVEHIVRTYCTTPELQADFTEVLTTTLHLQGAMLDGVWRAYSSRRESAMVSS